MSTETTGIVCLYFGDPCECQWCGGFVKAEGGPFEGDARYCSEDCFAEAAERARLAAIPDWCPQCGYDRHEHAPGCSGNAARAEVAP